LNEWSDLMEGIDNTEEKENVLTWSKLTTWVFILWVLGAIGFIVKGLNQAPISNVWHLFALTLLPLIYAFLPAVIFFIVLAFRSFKVEKCSQLAKILVMAYVVFILLQVTSSKPL